ncbi:MAG TPA: FAD/NAD(P)-binding oxidoreductase [Pseudonocardiaceae bacterium]|jgi:NADPH-dependent 2,4-dienoyl-CoA reductase/sulfur reductase-like enzyme|nr:FAD/NAD(P)-binding oxidoreductase [Pseudonocardiaceae bacterium]
MARVVVVGASMGGLRAAEAVRKAGFAGEIVVLGDEPHPPYNRPPLSKASPGGAPDVSRLGFRMPKAAQEIQWRLGTAVASADLTARTVTLADGAVLAWDGLVAATGLAPRRLALPGPTHGRCVLRTVDDAVELYASLTPGTRLVVIGAGFIGCEIAATARSLGVEVDVVAPESVPMERPLGAELGAAMRRRHEAAGVRFHLGTVPAEFLGQATVEAVVLADGTRLAADIVIEAVGCVPNVAWLAGNGLDLSDGLECDGRLRVQGRPDVVACGDLARFPNALFDDVPRRVEHWTMVTDTARRAGASLGRSLTGEDDGPAFAPVPTFWSDQYGERLQSFGAVDIGAGDVRVLEGNPDGEVAVGYHRDGELVGVVLLGMGGRYGHYRSQFADRARAVPSTTIGRTQTNGDLR